MLLTKGWDESLELETVFAVIRSSQCQEVIHSRGGLKTRANLTSQAEWDNDRS